MDDPTQRSHGAATIRQLSDLPHPEGRRQHCRYAVQLEVTVSSEHNFYTGLSENLSDGGVFVATHSLKAAGSIVELSIALPGDDAPLNLRGEVRWLREYSETSDAPPGIGIKFLALESTVADRIHSFLERRDPLFYDDD